MPAYKSDPPYVSLPRRHLLRAVVAALFLVAPGVGHAHDGGHGDEHGHGRHDHDEARLAVERGEIRPLAELLTVIRGKLPGEITGVEIERHHGEWLYEFIVVDKAGRLFEVYVDPNSGAIRQTREK
ncbi:PepSY domain-containing protein [Rhodopseudomonas sp. B29]|uniref:PepSY domain-containing protein n=1 Tax=Rhodopseudomonas sp. B29 TaxID=95607 RepID=UPI0003B6C4BC